MGGWGGGVGGARGLAVWVWVVKEGGGFGVVSMLGWARMRVGCSLEMGKGFVFYDYVETGDEGVAVVGARGEFVVVGGFDAGW